MKILTMALGATIVIACVGNYAAASSARAASNTPESVIREFYKWYIIAIEDGPDPFKKGKAKLKTYVTLRLINQIARDEAKGLDADAFVMTQDWDKEWANNVTVSKLNIKGTTATAIVTFGNVLNYPRVAVTLVKAAGTWKIDRVKDASK